VNTEVASKKQVSPLNETKSGKEYDQESKERTMTVPLAASITCSSDLSNRKTSNAVAFGIGTG
jgi:hypothetical protein